MRMLLAAAALAAATAVPAGADASIPNTVTASDGRLRATCSYLRVGQDLDLQPVEVRGVATAPPDGSIRLTCSLNASSGGGSVTEYGGPVTTLHGTVLLGAGPVTVCVDATASYTIDVPPNSVSRCETFDL